MADVRHANPFLEPCISNKSCARVSGVKQQNNTSSPPHHHPQQVTSKRRNSSEFQRQNQHPPGSVSSSPASLDADVNSLSTTSSTASSSLPLVPFTTCLQVRRGSEPVLNEERQMNCSSKRWSTAIAVASDSSQASGSCKRSSQQQEEEETILPSPLLLTIRSAPGPLGIHVVPYPDPGRGNQPNGMLIEKIEPGGRVDLDGRFNVDDWIVEVNGKSLLNCDFKEAEEIFKEALKLSSDVNLKVIKERSMTAASPSKTSEKPLPTESQQDVAEVCHEQTEPVAESKTTESNRLQKPSSPTSSPACDTKDSTTSEPAAEVLVTASSSKGSTLSANTRKMGRKYHIRLQKRVNGLGFSITTRDNPAGGNCPIYIKNILPKGSAIFDGRLKQGDRLLEVNGIEMTGKTQEQAVELLKSISVGSQVDLIVSRQESLLPLDPLPSPKVPRQIPPERAGDVPTGSEKQREVLTFEIPLNDTGSAGLGVSVKGKTSTSPEGETTDLGIFVKNVIHGGAASKDGRLKQNDQLISINGVHLLGLSNAEAMETLRRGMVSPDIGPEATPGVIKLTITRRVSASSVLNARHQENGVGVDYEAEKSCEDDDYGDDDENCCYNEEEEAFQRGGFGRQSMSEKRHAQLDAKNTDTYQNSKKVREGKQSKENSRSSSLEKGTPGRSSLGHRRVKSSVTTPKDLQEIIRHTPTPENKPIQLLADTPSRAKALFSPACCWSCQSPGSCSCRSHTALPVPERHQDQEMIHHQQESNRMHTSVKSLAPNSLPTAPVRMRSRSTGPVSVTTGIRKSGSLENLESMMQDLQKLQLEAASGGIRPSTLRVARSRVKNESFRAAVDRSYDAPRNIHPDQEGDIMETVDEGSESGRSSVDLQQTHLLHHRLNHSQYEAGYAAQPASGVLSMGCFTSHRPSTAAISLTSQTTGFSTITGTTTTTATSTGTSTDDDLALIRSSGHSSQHNGKDRESIKQKRGILNKLFKFGSRKEKKSAHASDRLIQNFGDRELEQQQMQAAARMHALSEQERIQEHVRRLKEQQQLLLRHQQQQKQLQLSHQIYQQQQQQQQASQQLHDSVVDDSDKYGHYMNHYQIQESMRNLGVGVPVAYSNRPIPARSRTVPQPPPPLPPGRPPLAHSSVRLRQHVSPTTTVIDARGVPVSRGERPLSNYYEYEGTSSLPPHTSINASAINQNVIYEQRLMHQQHQQQLMQQQQHEAALRTAQLRHQMLKQQQHQQQQQLHHAVLYQQPAASLTRMQSDLYGTSGLIVSPLEGSGLRPVDQNLFRRQLSNHRIVPTPQGLPVRVRQPVYQNHNVYVYSNPPVGNSPVFASSPHQSTSIIRSMANSQIHQASHL